MRPYCLALGLMIAAVFMLGACGSSGSTSKPSSFHYVQTTTSVKGGARTENHLEGWYKAPGSVRVVGDSATPFLEIVLLGSKAWVRDSRGWSAVDPESVRGLAMANVQAVLGLSNAIEKLDDAGAGPMTAGEPTRLYRDNSNAGAENYRKAIDELIARSSPDCTMELQALRDDLAAEVEQLDVVIGANTSRVYSMVINETRSASTLKTELAVDGYEAPVEIEAPPFAFPITTRPAATICG